MCSGAWTSENNLLLSSEEKLHTFEQKLSRWQNEIGVTDQAIIDSLLEDLGNIFTGSAKKTFGTFNIHSAINYKHTVSFTKN
jgi:hypothetical protein